MNQEEKWNCGENAYFMKTVQPFYEHVFPIEHWEVSQEEKKKEF